MVFIRLALGLPVAFCLMSNRKASTYVELFQRLKEEAVAKNENFEPKRIVTDFETTLVPAVRQEVRIRSRQSYRKGSGPFSFQRQSIPDVYFTSFEPSIGKLSAWDWVMITAKAPIFVNNAKN